MLNHLPRTAAVCLLLLAAHTAALAQPPTIDDVRQRLASGEPTRIVCFGDSITGRYYHTGSQRSWCDLLGIAITRAVPNARVEMFNAGASGHTTAQSLDRMDRDVIQHQPHLVVVKLGMNDVLRLPDIEQFTANMAEIVDRSHAAGAAVVLCTPNSVYDNDQRPNEKLDAYSDRVRALARERSLPCVDFFADFKAFRAQDELAWRLLMSDTIHPNLHGHRRFAELLAPVVTGVSVSLDDVPPLPPLPLRRAAARVAAGEPIRLVAMPPYDELAALALSERYPGTAIEVTAWPTEGQSIHQMRAWAGLLLEMKPEPDVIVVALPLGVASDGPEAFVRDFEMVLNFSLRSKGDLVVVSPDVLEPGAADASSDLAARIVPGKDMAVLSRAPGDDRSAAALLAERFAVGDAGE